MSCKPCCCVSSRTGAMVVGVLQIIKSAFEGVILLNLIQSLQNPTRDETQIWSHTDPDKVFLVMFFGPLLLLLQILFACLLIHGIRKDHLYLIKAELIFLILTLIVTAVNTILNFNSNYIGFLSFFVQFIPTFMQSVYTYVVYCAYLETQEMLSSMNEFHASMYPYFQPEGGQSGGVYDPESYSHQPPEGSYPPNYYPRPPPYPPKYYPQETHSQRYSHHGGSLNFDDENPPPNPSAEGTGGGMCVIPTTILPAMASGGIPLACTVM